MNKQQEPRLRFNGFTDAWEEKVLGEVTEYLSDGTHFSPKSQNGEYKYITSKNIRNSGLDLSDVSYISAEEHQEIYKRCSVKFGDLLLTKDGASTGNCCINFLDEEFSLLSSVAVLRPKQKKHNANFLCQVLQSPIGQNEIKGSMAGQAITRITLEKLRAYKFNFPLYEEQTHLGLFFRRLDSLIAESRAVLEKSRQLKKAMLAKMFPTNGEKIPKIRFKGFKGEWESRKLGEISDFAKGKGLSKSSIDSNGNTPCILYGELYTKYDCYINKVFSSTNEKIENPILTKSNDVLLPTSDVTPNGLAKACSIYFDDIVLGGDILVIRSTEMFGLFFAHYVESNPFMIIEKATGTTVFHIYEKDLRDIVLLLPSYEEQTAIGNFFRQLDETIALQSAEVEKLNQLKKGLLAAMLV
jgi:type I restriction-modification system protein